MLYSFVMVLVGIFLAQEYGEHIPNIKNNTVRLLLFLKKERKN